ncbi:hypothetical protein ATANTOWER_030309 [Ataeniobius toweri]|uniref:Secreted protein n=1 Tax=Ataeniobius toweri TaxID=208326 RepID=A0ABU7CEM7_9TELE|nr:hypothetical protein [Ataeniobius toweri]
MRPTFCVSMELRCSMFLHMFFLIRPQTHRLELTAPLPTLRSLQGVKKMSTRNTQQIVASTLSGKAFPSHLRLLSPQRSTSSLPGFWFM